MLKIYINIVNLYIIMYIRLIMFIKFLLINIIYILIDGSKEDFLQFKSLAATSSNLACAILLRVTSPEA